MRLAALSLFIAPILLAQAPGSDLAEKWRASGKYFTWKSSLAENQGRAVQVFYTCAGDAAKPAVLMVHGFPTSSFDFRSVIGELQADFHICALDFPGYGVSDKPGDGYRYTLADDAQLLWHFVTEVAPMKEFVLFSHDRGDSVALNFLQLYQAAANPPFRISYQFLTNANMYLPLANLTEFQKRMLDPATSGAAVKSVSAGLLAVGMGATNYTPPLKPDDPEVRALAFQFAFENGVGVIPATIQYLNERRKMEVSFLETLAKSTVPAAILWGAHDMVAPVRVADYVWDTALKTRKAAGAYWLMPCGNHYVLHDQPEAIARVVRLSLGKGPPTAPFNLSGDACAPVLIGREQKPE
jgi:pimeloyl-ACP methyl ester carboxylesterase